MKNMQWLWRIIWVYVGGILYVGTASAFVIDHQHTDITLIPESAINSAKQTLHIAYGHTSHGSQLTTGMNCLIAFANGGGLGLALPDNIFTWNNGGSDGALDLHDYAMGGDVGYFPQWVNNTENYLGNPDPETGRGTGSHSDVNVIIWSWCGQVSGISESAMITNYLTPMSELEIKYPGITFVYMTGHSNIWADTNTKARNNQIREYCLLNNKTLYDFSDIEHYDPDGSHFEYVNDNCDYYDSSTELQGNWATEWQTSHSQNIDWYICGSAHSQPLNANRKAYAAWWLWARLGGWNGGTTVYSLDVGTTGSGLVDSSPAGISCGVNCSAEYSAGTTVTLSAFPDGGWNFTGWSEDCSGSGTCEIAMDSAKSVEAIFSLQGDLDGNGTLSLSDGIIGLQLLVGMASVLSTNGDVNDDGQIGLAEIIYLLSELSEI